MKRAIAILAVVALTIPAMAADLTATTKQINNVVITWTRAAPGACDANRTIIYRPFGGRWRTLENNNFSVDAGTTNGTFTLTNDGQYRVSTYFDTSGTTEAASIAVTVWAWSSVPLTACASDSPLPALVAAMGEDAYVRSVFPANVDDITTFPVARDIQKMVCRVGHQVSWEHRGAGTAYAARMICSEIVNANFQSKYGFSRDLTNAERLFCLAYLGFTAKTYLTERAQVNLAAAQAVLNAAQALNHNAMRDVE